MDYTWPELYLDAAALAEAGLPPRLGAWHGQTVPGNGRALRQRGADRRRFERDYVAIEVRVPPDLVLELRDDDVPGDWRARPTSWSARASARFTSALPDDSASTSASRLVERQPFRGRVPEDRAEVAPMMPVTLTHDLWERLLDPAGLALQRGDVPCRARSVRRARYARRPIQVSSGISTRRSRG